jgi:uncharacterized short protein YbdD (DUF466 family)
MRWREALAQATRTARLMVGVPDYDAYLAHRRTEHPCEPAMTRTEFVAERTERRFGGGADRIGRCC